MSSIPLELIQSYLPISKQLFVGCSDSLFIGIADDGNHFLKHGIREGTKLVFDPNEPYKKGQLACFIDPSNRLHLLTMQKKDYKYLGKLVATISAF